MFSYKTDHFSNYSIFKKKWELVIYMWELRPSETNKCVFCLCIRRRVAQSTCSSHVPRHYSWRSSLRYWRSSTGQLSQWSPHANMVMRTSSTWWRVSQMAHLLAGRERARWCSTLLMIQEGREPAGCWKKMRRRSEQKQRSCFPSYFFFKQEMGQSFTVKSL